MSIAVRRSVPLKSRCSRKSVEPKWPSVSSRDPTPTHAPIVAERRPGIDSVSTRTPPGRTERRIVAPSCPAVSSAPASPAGTSGRSQGTSGVRALGRGSVGRSLLLDHGVERELAARVDLADLDLDLLADGQHVLDVLDALAAHELADLADVQQTVLARGERDERAERRRLDDRADEALADLRDVRVGDRVDRRAGGLGRRAVGGADVDGAVVLDGDVRARLLLDLVDHLALGPDDLAHPVA